jgi:hypothetical protein
MRSTGDVINRQKAAEIKWPANTCPLLCPYWRPAEPVWDTFLLGILLQATLRPRINDQYRTSDRFSIASDRHIMEREQQIHDSWNTEAAGSMLH